MRIREVGPRDGFQNEPERIATADKIRLIDALAAASPERIEVAALVRADVIPQLADGVEVLAGIDVPDGVSLSVLVPNDRGLDAALAHRDRIDEVVVFVSASDTHNRRNVNRPASESLATCERRRLHMSIDVHRQLAASGERHRLRSRSSISSTRTRLRRPADQPPEVQARPALCARLKHRSGGARLNPTIRPVPHDNALDLRRHAAEGKAE